MAADDSRHPDPDAPGSTEPPADDDRLPLLALEDAVCFPGMEMTVPLRDPEARRLARELMHRPEAERRAGVVLPMPDGHRDPLGRREVFPGGTVVVLLDLLHAPAAAGLEAELQAAPANPDADDAPRAVLAGEYRFEIARLLPARGPFREAVARPLEEAGVDDGDPAVADLRRRILACAAEVLPELADMVAFDADTLARLQAGGHGFEAVVNRLAAGLDLPPARKLELLLANLPERGRSLLSILESRRHVLDRLRPWRHLAESYELN